MGDLCTGCLVAGRKLVLLHETEYFHIYSQILNEIPVVDLSGVVIQICWECRAILRRIQEFKKQVKRCYVDLMQCVASPRRPRLAPHSVDRRDPAGVKTELPPEFHVKSEPEPEPEPEIDADVSGTAFADRLALGDCDDDDHDYECVASPRRPRLASHSVDRRDPAGVKPELPPEFHVKSEPEPETEIDADVSGTAFADRLALGDCDDDDDHDYEPEPEEPKKKVKLKKSETKLKKKKKKKRKKVNNKKIVLGEKEVLPEDKVLPDDFNEEKPPPEVGVPEDQINRVVEPNLLQPLKWSVGIEPATLGEKPKCEECGKMFSSKKTYRYHMNVLHKGNNQYPCPRCGKVYQWKSNLGRHMRTHKAVDAGELYCSLCDKSFASVATYRQHLKISRRHVSENDFNFVCNECGKKFVNKTRLRDHIDWEHLKKIKFRCQLCDKPFKCHTSLYVHTQNVHRDKEKKDNLCHVCGKSYQNAAKLKYHITAMHSGSSPYRCGECGAAFGWYSSLYRHIRELHYKMKVQPKKAKKSKKVPDLLFQPGLPPQYPMQPPG